MGNWIKNALTTSTTEPNVITAKTRNASHCTNRGDLVDSFAIILVFIGSRFLLE